MKLGKLPTVQVRGMQGSYFVETDQFGRLPTAHKHLLKWPHYEHPGPRRYGRELSEQWLDQCKAIMEGKLVVLTEDDTSEPTWKRRGYIGIFKVDDASVGDEGALRFRIIDRIADCRP